MDISLVVQLPLMLWLSNRPSLPDSWVASTLNMKMLQGARSVQTGFTQGTLKYVLTDKKYNEMK